MAKTKIRVKVSPGKSRGGTLIARSAVKLQKMKATAGKPMFQTRAQIDVHLLNKNGEPRARSG